MQLQWFTVSDLHKRCGKNTASRGVWPSNVLFPFPSWISPLTNPLFLRSLHPLLLRLPSSLLPLDLWSFILTWMFIYTRLRIGTSIFASIKTSLITFMSCACVSMFMSMSMSMSMSIVFVFVFVFVFMFVLIFISKVRFWFSCSREL